MIKKKHNPVEALKKAFEEVVNDPELQGNYDRFKSALKRAKNEHNELVPVVNRNLDEILTLKESILNLAMLGIISTEARDRVLQLEADNEDMIHMIERYKSEIDENQALIEKYDSLNDHKLFVWWQALVAVDPETLPWLEWKETFKDKII